MNMRCCRKSGQPQDVRIGVSYLRNYRRILPVRHAAQHPGGFQIKVVGQSPRAARVSPVSVRARLASFCLSGSGALAGLAGISEVSGAIGQLQ